MPKMFFNYILHHNIFLSSSSSASHRQNIWILYVFSHFLPKKNGTFPEENAETGMGRLICFS